MLLRADSGGSGCGPGRGIYRGSQGFMVQDDFRVKLRLLQQQDWAGVLVVST